MSDFYDMAAPLAELEGETAQVVTFGGADYPCYAGDEGLGRMLGEGGFALDAEAVVVLRTAHFASKSERPRAQQTVTFNANSYRIADVRTSPCDTFIVLALANDSRGA